MHILLCSSTARITALGLLITKDNLIESYERGFRLCRNVLGGGYLRGMERLGVALTILLMILMLSVKRILRTLLLMRRMRCSLRVGGGPGAAGVMITARRSRR